MALVRKYFFQGLAVSLLLGLVFAFLGVYDTNYQPLHYRYVFWTSTMLVGTLSTGFALPLVTQRLCANQHRLIQLLAVSVLISFPVTLVLAGFDRNFGSDWSLITWLLQYRYVLVISLIVIYGSYFILKAQGVLDSPAASNQNLDQLDNEGPVTKFLERLPLSYQDAQLYAVSSEDHYLRVYTDKGETLILMRLSDALRELETVKGMQTHRSWWVAKEAVVECKRKQGKQTLKIKSGVHVPVSRSFDKAIREAF